MCPYYREVLRECECTHPRGAEAALCLLWQLLAAATRVGGKSLAGQNRRG